MLIVMLFVIILLIAQLIALFSILVGTLCYFTCTEEDIDNLRNAGRDKLTFFEYWFARYALWCLEMFKYAYEKSYLRKEA